MEKEPTTSTLVRMATRSFSFSHQSESGQDCSSKSGHTPPIRMMYWRMKNHKPERSLKEGFHSAPHCYQAGGAEEPRAEGCKEIAGESPGGLRMCCAPSEGVQLFVVPSLHPGGPTAKLVDHIEGLRYYEERQLYHLFLLRKRDPTFRVIFISSTEVPREVIAYYFRLMRSTGKFVACCPPLLHYHCIFCWLDFNSSVDSYTEADEADWWSRLVLLPMGDSSSIPISKKILRHDSFLSVMRSQFGSALLLC